MEKIIKKNQFVVIPAGTDPNEKKYEAWQTLRDSGMTLAQIAKMFHTSAMTISQHTVMNVNLRDEAKHRNFLARLEYYKPLMLKLRALGYSNMEIAEKTGFCDKTIRNYIGNNPDEVRLAVYRVTGAKKRLRNLAAKNQIARDNNEPIPAVAKVIKKEVA